MKTLLLFCGCTIIRLLSRITEEDSSCSRRYDDAGIFILYCILLRRNNYLNRNGIYSVISAAIEIVCLLILINLVMLGCMLEDVLEYFLF